MKQEIRINKDLFDKIRIHGERTYDEECCGAILGESQNGFKFIHNVIPFDNQKNENRERRYLISPDQYRESEKIAVENNFELLGFYHSHPDHPSEPSKFDTDHALPWFLYLIVSVQKGRAESLTAWQLNEDRERFENIEINII